MPSAFSHFIFASQVLEQTPAPLKELLYDHLPLYFFGAQGADFCFFYPVFKSFSKVENFGRYLHKKGGYAALCVCKAFALDERLYAYTLGYLTHYAADTVFHPFVYAQAGKSPLRHSRVEAALDSYFAAKQESCPLFADYFGKQPTKDETDELFLLYAAISANAGFPPLDKPAFLRAVRLFNAYLPLPNAVFGKQNKLRDRLVNIPREPWTHPHTGVEYTDGAEELFTRTITQTKTLVSGFLQAIKNRTPLPRDLFAKNYLSGL